MKRIKELVAEGKVLVSDGAWGTFLHKKGLRVGECPELWCVIHRAAVLDIAQSYLSAGAAMVKTNSFGGSRFKLEVFGLKERVPEINAAAASISREAAGQDKHVLASIGPTGKMLLMGDVTEAELLDAFSEQAIALEKGGADAALIESMYDLSEACLAIRAVRQNTRLEIICTFTYARTAQGEYRTMMGVSPSEMVPACLEAGAEIVGANCGNGFQQMVEIIREIRGVADGVPIILHANAGAPVNKNGVAVFPETPQIVAGLVPELIAAGADIIGGCCGTTPAHIAAIVGAVRGS